MEWKGLDRIGAEWRGKGWLQKFNRPFLEYRSMDAEKTIATKGTKQ